MTVVSMHQPNFLPYVGFFDKIRRSDIFIIVDHLTFSKGKDNWHHRNKIRTTSDEGWDYITIPVSEHWNWRPFNQVMISDVVSFKKKKHIKTMEMNYRRAPFFKKYFEEFKDVYLEDEKRLSEFNIKIIKWFIKKFNINVKVYRSSELTFDKSKAKTDMIIELMKSVNGTTFISGDGAIDYIEEDKFTENGIELVFQNFKPTDYPQVYPGFVPFMSAFDLLMNCGGMQPNGSCPNVPDSQEEITTQKVALMQPNGG